MNEQLSALIDDEMPIEEATHLIAAAQSNKTAALAWQQYHLIGDAMRGDALLSANFKQSLMQKIDAEPTVLAPNMQRASTSATDAVSAQPRINFPTRWSMAASFAAVMVVSYMALQNMHDTQEGVALVAGNVDLAVQSNEYAAVDNVPMEYLMAHQASSPSASSYYIQTTSYSE